ncbi:hypothetical protein Tco_0474434 [Tanacetum coccineum]
MQLSHAAYLLSHSVLVESSNGWIVLTAEDKLTYLEHPIPDASIPAHPGQQIPIDVLTAHTNWVKVSKEIACLMLVSMMPELQKNLEHFVAYDMLENHVFTTSRTDKLERLGHPVSLGLAVSLILTSLSNEYDEFVHNYNMHGIGKILADAPKPKIPTPPKKDNPGKDAICHQCGEVYDTGCGTHICNTTQGLRGSKKLKPVALNLYMDNGHCADVEAIKRIEKLQHDGLFKSTEDESFDKCVSCMSRKMTRQPFPHQTKRTNDLLGLIHTDVCGPFRTVPSINMKSLKLFEAFQREEEKGYPKETIASRSLVDLEEIQVEHTHHSKNTSEHHDEGEQQIVEPESDVIPICRSTRTRHAPDRLRLFVDAEEHELRDHNEPTNYKAALLDSKSNK